MSGIARPILLGRRPVIERKVREMGLRIDLTEGVRVLDPAQDADVFGPLLAGLPATGGAARHPAGGGGVSPDRGAARSRRRCCCMPGLADAAICGGSANWWRQVQYLLPIIPRRAVSRACTGWAA